MGSGRWKYKHQHVWLVGMCGRLDGSVDGALRNTNMRHLTALRENEFQKKKAAFPFSLLLPLLWFCGQVGTVVLEHASAVCLCA